MGMVIDVSRARKALKGIEKGLSKAEIEDYSGYSRSVIDKICKDPELYRQKVEKQEEKLKKELEGTEDFKEAWQKEFARDWEEITGTLQMYMNKSEEN